MSAGICIMNKNAIAMAADSAVTIGQHVAIHNSANKLFSLYRIDISHSEDCSQCHTQKTI